MIFSGKIQLSYHRDLAQAFMSFYALNQCKKATASYLKKGMWLIV
jgi:hypothetical protein